MKFYRLNIKRKIWLSIILPTFLIAFITGLLLFYHSRNVASDEARYRMLESTQKYGNELESAIKQLELVGNMMEGLVTGSLPLEQVYGSEAGMQQYKKTLVPMVDSLARSMRPTSLWIVFNPELAPGAHSVSFYDHNMDGRYSRSTQYRVTERDLTSERMQWWTKGVSHGEYWSLRYYWKDWNMELISYAKAVTIDSLLIGVAGSDFGFSRLREQISRVNIYESGFLFLLDSNFNILIHPSHQGKPLQKAVSTEHYRQFTSLVDTSRYGIVSFADESKKQLMSYSKLDNGWILGAIAPLNEVYAGSRELTWMFIALVILMLSLAWGIASMLGRSLVKPVYELIESIRNAREGDFKQRVKVDGSREVRELSEHFNLFMQSIDHLMHELDVSEKELLEARMKAEEAEKLKSAFLANISHEFRTPLTSIQGIAQLLADTNVDGEERRQYLAEIQRQIDHILKLIDDLLELSRLKMNELQLNYRAFNLNRMLRFIKNQYKDAKPGVEFYLTPGMDDAEAWIVSDEQRLKRILEILLDNAFKFTDAGKVHLSYQQNEQMLEFILHDTGDGIPPEKQKVIFEQFRQADVSMNRNYEGAGVGLAIAKQIAENMQGGISLHSEPGKGSTFYLHIPYTKSQNQRLPKWLKNAL